MSTQHRLVRLTLLGAALALAGSACGAKAEGHVSGSAAAPTPTGGTTGGTQPNTNNDKPKFASDYERTCTDAIGFGGAAPYTKSKAVHPAVLLTKTSTNTWIDQEPSDWPTGWTLGYPKDVSQAELVACYERTGSTPAGKVCDMEDDKTHQPFKLTMYNTSYRIRVLESRTGKVLYSKTGQATSTECPSFTFSSGDDDRSKYYTDLQPRDYRTVVKPYIQP
jgi:hypothetical protein